jgi:hypothetical protein
MTPKQRVAICSQMWFSHSDTQRTMLRLGEGYATGCEEGRSFSISEISDEEDIANLDLFSVWGNSRLNTEFR